MLYSCQEKNLVYAGVMKLSFEQKLDDLKPVLLDPKATGPDPVYQVFTELEDERWVNKTVISAGKIGKEYPKTFGHYHVRFIDEIYHRSEGEGVLLLQRKHFELGEWAAETVDEVLLIKVNIGDELIIKPDFGHAWVNVGKGPLVLFDNWGIKHVPEDYDMVKKLAGMAYYIVEEDGKMKAVPNSNYKNLPVPIWLTAKEFEEYGMTPS